MLNKHKWFLLAGLYTVLVIVVSLVKIEKPVQVKISHADKLVHMGIYFLCTIAWFVAFANRNTKTLFSRALLKASIVAFVVGVGLEFLQELSPNTRTGDVKDVLANCLGIIIAVLFLRQIKNRLPLNSIK